MGSNFAKDRAAAQCMLLNFLFILISVPSKCTVAVYSCQHLLFTNHDYAGYPIYEAKHLYLAEQHDNWSWIDHQVRSASLELHVANMRRQNRVCIVTFVSQVDNNTCDLIG
jgi:hypothetical protein